MADSAVVPNHEAPPHLLRETVVRPTSGWRSLNLGRLFLYRDLLMFLVWRDLKVRYQQTILGSAWAIIQPLATMVVFTVVFGKLAKLPSDGVPYPLFSFTALVIWTYFSQAVNGAVNSLIGNTQLIEKVYFPRLILPIAAVVRGLADLAISFAFLIAMLAFYGVWPTWKVVFVIPFTLLAIVATVGKGHDFTCGRQFCAWLGLVPGQYSSGGKQRLGRITKAGDPYLRTLRNMAGTAVLAAAKTKTDPGGR